MKCTRTTLGQLRKIAKIEQVGKPWLMLYAQDLVKATN